MELEVDEKLVSFRKLLVENNLDGYLLPRTDAHCSEYLPEWEERAKFISGFSGSNALHHLVHGVKIPSLALPGAWGKTPCTTWFSGSNPLYHLVHVRIID